MAENADLVRDIYKAWNERDFDRMVESQATDATLVDLGSGETYRGRDGVRKYATAWADGFPDAEITVDRVIEAGDMIVA